MERRSDNRPHPLWLAAGTGLVGVSLGATAVLLGLRTAERQVREPMPVPVSSVVSAPERPAVAPPAVVPVTTSTPPLVDAVAQTRDAVVNLGTERRLGAGVIVDPQGLVVTNYHVIADALEAPRRVGPRTPSTPSVTARFEDGRVLSATILVADRVEDLAILRLQAQDDERFAAVALGESAALSVGQEVFAIGNPFGLNHSVSRGIVSALDRTDVLRNRPLPLIQLDASINLGNSGGPLFSLDGALVGIVTLRRQDAEGIAFAVPVDHVRGFLRAVSDPASPRRSGAIGVEIVPERAPSGGSILGYAAWLEVSSVNEGTPADVAGLRQGDRVVEIRGKRLDGLAAGPADGLAAHLVSTVRSMFPGERLPLTIIRDGSTLTVEVEVAAAPSDQQVSIDAEDLLGLRLRAGSGVPVIEGVLPRTPFADLRRNLARVEVVRLFDREIRSMEELGAELARLRELLRSGRGPLRVRVGLRDPAQVVSGDFMILVE